MLYRRYHILAFAFIIAVACGCAETSQDVTSSSNAPSERLITKFGQFSPTGSPWVVKASADDRKLMITRRYAFGHTDVSQNVLKAEDGWFAFIENDERVWVYYGGEDLYLLVALGTEGTAFYGTRHFPCPVPDEVLARISPAVRQAIKSDER